MSFDAHKNFAISIIAAAPTPAASGTTFSVTAGEGALFPTVPFNAVVWPAGANPTAANAEIVRVTSKGTGDNWTATRTTESSSARSIAVGDQICAAITAKMITDIETAQAADAAALTSVATGRVPGGRLTLTTALPVTTTDVTAAGTLYYTPYHHNIVALYSGTAWADFTFPELSIAVPAVANQMYDVFVFDSAGTRTLELLAWTNDTTRATALVRQDGHWCKTGALTRLYVGSFRTTGTISQTEDSAVKRYVWNAYNRVRRQLKRFETTNSWAYTTNTWRQANAAVANQVDVVVGLAEVLVTLEVFVTATNGTGAAAGVAIGLDGTTAPTTQPMQVGTASSIAATLTSSYHDIVAIGRHFYTWLEASQAAGTTTWTSNNTAISGALVCQSGLIGWIEG